jgi:hypothetical protein
MSATNTLFCWVIGASTNGIFPVKIALNELWYFEEGNQGGVQVEDKGTFDDIFANPLSLWKVSRFRYEGHLVITLNSQRSPSAPLPNVKPSCQ